MINGHGDDTHDFPGQIRSNFSSNMYPGIDPSGLHHHLCSRIGTIHAYPEPDAVSLRQKLAEKNGLTPEHFCVTNGATEAIYLIAQACRNAASMIVTPTFSEYEDACRIHRHRLVFTPDFSDAETGVNTVWLCEPNNPTGKVLGKKVLSDLIEGHPQTLFVIDQSYAAFTEIPQLEIREAVRYKNVILIRSMTKRYAIPGLRLGYIAAHPERIVEITAGQMPWAVNALSIEAGLFLLDQPEPAWKLSDYLAETRRLQNALSRIVGIEVLLGDTPFFLCRLKEKKASELKRYLIEQHGILIRDAANFRGLDEHYYRICTQTPEENNALIKAIETWI